MVFAFLLGKIEAVASAATTRALSGLCRPAVLAEPVYYFQVSPTLDIPCYYSNNPRLFVFFSCDSPHLNMSWRSSPNV